MNRTRQIATCIFVFLTLFLSLPQPVPAQEDSQGVPTGQISPQEAQDLLKAYQEGKINPETVKALQEKGTLGTLTPEEIQKGREILKQKKGETQVQELETSAGLDLVDYVNHGLKAIEDIEKRAMDRYDSVTGKNYFTDEKVYDALKNDVIPGYSRFFDLLKDIHPRTEVVFTLHQAYIKNTGDILSGFKAKMEGLESKDAMMNQAANRQIESGRKANEKWREDLKSLRAKYGIEELGEEKKPVKPDTQFFKKDFGPARPSLEIFGQKLFSNAPSTFAPIESMPVSNDYIIGPGDEIKVLMWGRLDASYSLTVDNEGTINFPKIGPLTVAGLTFEEVKNLISRKAEAITGVNVNVSMGRLRTIQVFVLGEVKDPGVYTVSSLATIANALLSSGGPTSLGSLRMVSLKRNGKVITVIDLYDFLLKGDTSADTRLMPGDVIFVPQAGPMVSVWGNVKRPAIYELKEDKTLKTALDLAGGLTPWAFNQRIQIERASKNERQIVLDISYKELRQKKPTPLRDGDLIRVFPINPESVNAVYLYGNVVHPGQYSYRDGLRLTDILPNLEGLDKDTYFDYALIKRYHFEDMSSELIPFDLGRLLLSKDESQNIPLRPLDEVYVFNKRTFEDRDYAVVDGQVRRPGRYFIDSDGMRIRDLIFKAGGLTKDAYVKLGHLYRTAPRTEEKTILSFNVERAMDSDPQYNMLLKDQDSVVIHSIWDYEEKYTVSINGMVHKPGDYPYAVNMKIKDLVLMAGNMKDAAFTKQAELVRFDIVNGKEVKTSIINFDVLLALKNDPANNLKLQPLDVINIKQIPEWWDKKKTVTISGEVYFPGDYQIRKDEHLTELLERAGGYSEHAYLRGAMFTRESVRMMQQKRLDDLMKRLELEIASYGSGKVQAALSKEDLALQAQFISSQRALIDKLRETKASGRVVIALRPINELKGTSNDTVLEDGDSLYIPQRPNTVNVLGAVYNPTSLVYEKDRPRLKYYLNKTGGPTANAEEGQMYIIRADGTVVSKQGKSWFRVSWDEAENRWAFGGGFNNASLYPGDTILVPQKIVRPSYMRNIKDVTQIVYQIAVIAGITATQVF